MSGQARGRPARLAGTVVALGAVSFLTDLSSEMIYPLLPVFLTTVLAAGPAALGVVEGAAEAVASLLKLASGAWTDRTHRRTPLIVAGYGIAGAARPLIGLAGSWAAVLALRVTDRVGKGLRTSPRDALIADVTPPELRGRAFGLHRAMDHAGAVAGPLVAAALLSVGGIDLRRVFLLAAVPAALVMVVLAAGVRDRPRAADESAGAGGSGDRLDPRFRRLVVAILVFTLGNSTDAFLLLRLGRAGLAPAAVALVWSLFHVVKSLATYAGGRLSDRTGRRPMVLGGWLIYAGVYASFAVLHSLPALLATFLAYGLYFGLTEPAEKAWVAELAPAGRRGRAFGTYNAAVGLAALPSSVVFGLLWQRFGPEAAFLSGAVLALAACVLLLRVTTTPALDAPTTRG